MRENAKIHTIIDWSHELHQLIMGFKNRHNVFPNVLLASEKTYRRIDLVANSGSRKSIRTPEGNIPDEPVVIKSFSSNIYHVSFFLKPELPFSHVILIFDDTLTQSEVP